MYLTSKSDATVEVSPMILYTNPFYIVLLPFNEINGDSNFASFFVLVLILFLFGGADRTIILFDTHIYGTTLLSFCCFSIQFHHLSYLVVDNSVELISVKDITPVLTLQIFINVK